MAKKASTKAVKVESTDISVEEKKKALPEYRKARDEMRELLTVKANVEKIMGFENHKERNVQNLE